MNVDSDSDLATISLPVTSGDQQQIERLLDKHRARLKKWSPRDWHPG